MSPHLLYSFLVYHQQYNTLGHQSSNGGGGNSEPENLSEVEDGPSFREALKAFQSKSACNSAAQSPVPTRANKMMTNNLSVIELSPHMAGSRSPLIPPKPRNFNPAYYHESEQTQQHIEHSMEQHSYEFSHSQQNR